MRIKKSWIAAAAVPVAVLGGAGIAFATWTATGSGAGSSAAIAAKPLVVTAVTLGPAAATLYPGGPAGTVYYTVNNPNPYSVEITQISWGTPTSNDSIDCPSTNVSIDVNAPTSPNVIVPPSAVSDSTFSTGGVVDLSHNAPDGCQGVGFTIPMTISGVQT